MFAPRDVHNQIHHSDHVPRRIVEGSAGQAYRQVRPVFIHAAMFKFGNSALGDELVLNDHQIIPHLFRNDGQKMTDHFLLGPSVHAFGSGIPRRHHPFQIERDNTYRRSLNDRLEHLVRPGIAPCVGLPVPGWGCHRRFPARNRGQS